MFSVGDVYTAKYEIELNKRLNKYQPLHGYLRLPGHNVRLQFPAVFLQKGSTAGTQSLTKLR